ncbi:Maf-like protein isoform D [Glycine soja]|uniref:Maf-like protein isoform D n=1 Tax=Glycine soja TaxID=3848 RepID=A0A445GIE7_GLYSO|nr:Maf-like protein isoform D [Glycine soja]
MATKNPPFKIILGSSSKARREILSEMGYEFTVMTADIDEKCIRREKPEDLVMALAEAKADAIVQRLPTGGPLEEDASTTLLITADTVVVYRGVIREKPTSEKEARDFIKGFHNGCQFPAFVAVIGRYNSHIHKFEHFQDILVVMQQW